MTDAFLPPWVTVPLSMHGPRTTITDRSRCMVKKGDSVEEGQLLCAGGVHSPVPGKICDILKLPLADGTRGWCVKILTGGSFSYLGRTASRHCEGEAEEISTREGDASVIASRRRSNQIASMAAQGGTIAMTMTDTLRKNGVINTFDSIHTTRRPVFLADQCEEMNVNAIVVCLGDEDPSVKTVAMLAELFPGEIKQGAVITAQASGAKRVVFIGSKDLVELYQDDVGGSTAGEIASRVAQDGTIAMTAVASKFDRYPSAFQSDLIVRVPNLPQRGVLFTDAITMLRAREAVLFDTPAMTSYVYIGGEGLSHRGLLRVRIGTPIGFLADQCGGIVKTMGAQSACDAIVINGFMDGYSASMDTPIDKYVKSVMFVPRGVLRNQGESECVMCGNCREVCPQGLLPDVLFATCGTRPVAGTTASRCTGCALCNSVCPARLPLVQNIMRYAHTAIAAAEAR